MNTGNLSSARLARMHQAMAHCVEVGEIPGIVALVSRQGAVYVDAIGSQAVGGQHAMRRDTIFRIASLTKPITAVAAMMLIEECKLRLDEPVDPWLPELANRRVLRHIDAPLHDTVAAKRSITVRDLLTLRMGIGHIMAPSSHFPIRKALDEQELLLGAPKPQSLPHPDEWMRRVGALPLMYQPGERWLYDLGLDVLGVLIARVSGQSFDLFLRQRIFEPLGMKDTGFHVPPEKLERLASCYAGNRDTGSLDLYDGVEGSAWAQSPAFPSGSGGLVSTADDYLAFCRMLLNEGRQGRDRLLSRPAVQLITADHLTAAQRAAARVFFGDSTSWGFGVGIDIARGDMYRVPGRFGWTGGFGTSGYTDPKEKLIGILLTQKMMTSPVPPPVFVDFWSSAYQAIDD